MKVLALETSMSACSVALLHNNLVDTLHEQAPRKQTKLLLPMIKDLLHKHALTVESLDAIAYGCGPGSFTGIRIAGSVAQALGFAAKKPLIAISSLAILAQTAYLEKQCRNVLIATHAHTEKIYWAAYQVDENDCMKLQGQEQICRPHEIDVIQNQNWGAVGDGWSKYKELLTSTLGFQPISFFPDLLANANGMLPLARLNFDQTCFQPASQVLIRYLQKDEY